jgi:hypothetical protein
MKLGPLRLGIIGVLMYLASLAWIFLYFRIVNRNNPPGWTFDRATPDGPKFVAMLGADLVLVAVLWAAVRVVRSRS